MNALALPTMTLLVKPMFVPPPDYDDIVEICDQKEPVGKLVLRLAPLLKGDEVILLPRFSRERFESMPGLGALHALRLFEARARIPREWSAFRLLFTKSNVGAILN